MSTFIGLPEQAKFKLVSVVHNCLHHKAPRYLMDYCIPISVVITSLCLDTVSARMVVGHLLLPARLTVWNSLSDDLRDPSLRQRRSVLYRRRTISVTTKKD